MAHEIDPSLQGRLRKSVRILDQVEKQLRRLSHELRPTILDDLGLLPALEFLAGSVSKRAGLSIRIHSTLKDRYAHKIETAVYRVIQEALTNITKHAHAKNVEIRLPRSQSIYIAWFMMTGWALTFPLSFRARREEAWG